MRTLLPPLLALLATPAASVISRKPNSKGSGKLGTLVLRTTFGAKPVKLVRPLVRHYEAQLKDSGFRFSMLHDMTTDAKPSHNLALAMAAHTDSSIVAGQLGFKVDFVGSVQDKIAGRKVSVASGWLYTGDPDDDTPFVDFELERQVGGDGEQGSEEQLQQPAGVPICVVSWAKAQEKPPSTEINPLEEEDMYNHPFLQRKFVAHDHNLVLWHRHCSPAARKARKARQAREASGDSGDSGDESQGSKVWFANADAYYNGDIKKFMGSFDDKPADLIASGFRIAGQQWKKWDEFKETASALPQVKYNSKVVANLALIPAMRDSPKECQEKGLDRQGLLFFQDNVMRVSERLLEAVSDSMARGVIGTSEALMATMCGTGFGIQGCTMEDFSPATSNKGWTSEKHWWYCLFYESKRREHCKDPNLKNRWINHFKILNVSEPLACPFY
mmetsp:Transcript_65641/g.186243  ORF Transcript_65641/g.186243 Transcript_65641/m.186243 type:complete len:444 (-) Transcript_65641:61-1392(-)